MFGAVAAFEFRYQLRQPLFWVVGLFAFLLTFLFMVAGNIQIGDTANLHKNGPYAVAQTNLILSAFFMFVTAAFAAGSVVRDDETGFGQILRATRVSKFDYLYGRFAGGLAAAALAFLAVPLAIVAGSLAPWVDPETNGPLMWRAFVFAYVALALPTLFLTAAMFFALATVTRSMGWTFVGAILFLVVNSAAAMALSRPELAMLFARLEPLGMAAFDQTTRYWTAAERNSLVPALHGLLLWNRLYALGLGAGFLALAYPLFRFQTIGSARRPSRASGTLAAQPPPASASTGTGSFDGQWVWAQFAARARLDLAQVFKSPVFWVLMGLGLANAANGLWFATEDTGYGGALYPVTRILIPVLHGAFVLFAMIIAIYFAGELVWRERDRGTHEFVDAAPTPDWTYVAPKTAAVALVLVASLGLSVLSAIAVQLGHGYGRLEIGKYLLWFLLPASVDCTLLAALAVFIQVVSPHKFVGWGVMVLFIVAAMTLPNLGFEHGLYNYDPYLVGRAVGPFSDMNGQGRFWIGPWWFRLYWSAFALLLLTAAYGLWRRGVESRLRPRLVHALARLRGPAGLVAGGAVAVMLASGLFIYQNTNVWNQYRTRQSNEAWKADYEKTLLPFERVPQPTVVSVKLDIDIHPHEPRLETRGVYVIENRTGQPLREVHVRFDRDARVLALSVQGAWPKTTYDRFNYRIWAFDSPLKPGEQRRLSFTTLISQKGFRNSGDLTRVLDNGTFVDSSDIAPSLGMTREDLLTDRTARRRHGLPSELHPAPLGDVASRQFSYIDHVGWVNSDITVTTDADQTPIAPGYRVSDVTRAGRRTARFVTEAPILQFFSIQSARYAVRTERYKGVDLSVYYDPQHAWNVRRMIDALKVSLDYDQANFGRYQFRQVRIVEFPDYAQFAQSFAGTIPWSEGLGFIADARDPSRIDLVTYVAAHELAHQWWAHQVVGADQQGATALSETLAQYSALMVMKRLYGPDMIRKFLRYELDAYLRARGAEGRPEVPLERVEDQPYIHYRKGALVMYRLADEIGEDKVNAALRSLVAQYAFKGPPYPTALDLVAALRREAPADKQALITDLFERITIYDLKATRAVARQRPDGRWDVAVTIDANKLYADGKGAQTAAPFSEAMDVGVFTAEPGKAGFSAASVLALVRRPIHSGEQTITFTVARRPTQAGVDPYNKLIDRSAEDNLVRVTG
ncbi:MAG: ABC transporter permease/M1 family aminopeptidase [Caulobacterales bacterium]